MSSLHFYYLLSSQLVYLSVLSMNLPYLILTTGGINNLFSCLFITNKAMHYYICILNTFHLLKDYNHHVAIMPSLTFCCFVSCIWNMYPVLLHFIQDQMSCFILELVEFSCLLNSLPSISSKWLRSICKGTKRHLTCAMTTSWAELRGVSLVKFWSWAYHLSLPNFTEWMFLLSM